MKDRIRELLEYSGYNQNVFAEKISVAAATLSNILKGKTKPSLEIVQNIRSAFPEVNLLWLLDGKGSMLNSEVSSSLVEKDQSDMPDHALHFSGDLFPDSKSQSDSMDRISPSAIPSKSVHSSISNEQFPGQTLASGYQMAQSYTDSKDIKMVKIIDKPLRKVKEIQVFYDDDTYEVFVPRK